MALTKITSRILDSSGVTILGTIATGVWAATDIAVLHGGTGASTASAARTNLGLVIGTHVLAQRTFNDTNWDNAYTDRLKWDGGATGLTASTGRTSLGLGTVATTAASDYATAAQGTKADTAHGWGNHTGGGYVKTTTDQTIAGVKTFSGTIIPGSTDSIRKSVNNSLITVSGGNATNAGANYSLFGGTHSTIPNTHRWRIGSSEAMRVNPQKQLWVGGSYTGSDIANGNASYLNNINAGAFSVLHRNAADAYIHFNTYYNSSNNYIAKYGGAQGFRIDHGSNGGLSFHSAPVVTSAGDTQSFGHVMTVGYGTNRNVGIGTTSPTSKLEVIVTQSNTMTDDTAAFAIKGNGGDGLLMGQRSSSPYAAWIAAGYLQNIGTSHNYPLALQPHGGNVGIGSTNPTHQLTLTSNDSFNRAGFQTILNGGADQELRMISDAHGGGGRTGFLTFYTADSTTPQERLRISSGGNVGIGTTTLVSTAQLTVVGNYHTDFIRNYYGSDRGYLLRFGANTASSGYVIGSQIAGSLANNDADGSLEFFTKSSGTLAERLRISSGGSVGIGGVSTSYKLRIVSDATVDNGVYISAGSSSSNHILYVENQNSSAEYFAVRGDGEIRLNASSGHTYAARGIRFGANSTANNLNDYEEGTWTPSLKFGGANTGMSYAGVAGTSSRGGHYTKIGRVVTYSMRVILANKGTATGSATIEGLPFIVANLPGNYGSAMYSYANNFIIPERASITIDGGNSTIRLRYTRTNSISADVNNSDFLGNTTIILVGTYLSI